MKRGIIAGVVLFFLVVIAVPYRSHAVPSYARQVKKPCTACHTIWPNLNQYGRQFKVKAYTDVSPDWEMINKDNLNLSTVLPFSARVLYFPMVREDNAALGTGEGSSTVDSVQLFLASRVYDYAGVFGSAEWSPDDDNFHLPTVKLAFEYPVGQGNTIGLVGFKGLSSAADPFNSLGGRDRDIVWGDESLPFILTQGWTFSFFSEGNIGTVLHGYFIGNRLYAAVGALRGGLTADASGGALVNSDSTVSESDPNDLYSRIAWDQKLPNGAITFGACYYDGTQRVLGGQTGITLPFASPYDTKVKRGYVDLSLEQNFGEDHLVEIQALGGNGKETNVFGGGEERKFDGFYVQASYFFQRMVGLVGSINMINFKDVSDTDFTALNTAGAFTDVTTFGADKIKSWLVGVEFLPWLNTKVAFQYASTHTDFVNAAQPDQTDKISRVVFDVAF